ncbi:MAG TPA: DUF5698 domain-containing protein [bacterium]|jgi:uncharacterized protein YebE (UPF0316 family)
MIEFLHANTWLLLTAVFLSRIADQTLDTFRTISIFRGYRFLAALMGFLTVLIWINVAGQVITNLSSNWYLSVVYAAGFAAGQATGLWVEGRIALGHQFVRILARQEVGIAEKLWEQGYSMTELDGHSKAGPIDVVFVVVKRQKVRELCKLINQLDPEAFFTVEEIKQVGLRHVDPGLVLGRKLLGGVGDFVTYPMREGRKIFLRSQEEEKEDDKEA